MSQSELARQIGVKQPSVSGWVRSSSRPEQHHRIAIERLLHIPASDWMTDDEVAVAAGGERVSGPHLPDASESGEHSAVAPIRRSETG